MANSKSNYFVYTHNDSDVLTLGDFVGDPLSIGIGLSIVDLLNYEDQNGRKNLDNLKARYTADQLITYKSLLDQIANTAKAQAAKTSTTTSVTKDKVTSSIKITKSDSPNPDSLVKLTDPIRLRTNLSDYQSFISGNKLSNAQKSFIDSLLDNDAKKLFTKFILKVQQSTNYIIVITSARRSYTQQQQLIAQGNANASSGFSYHFPGLALDIALKDKRTRKIYLAQQPYGLEITSTQRTEVTNQWYATGVPQIAASLNMQWGGLFSDNFDPVHFDLRHYYYVNKASYLDAISTSSDNTTNTDSTTNVNDNPDDISSNATYSDLALNLGTVLNLPLTKIDRQVLATETNQASSVVDYPSFLARELFYLLRDPKYERSFVPKKTTLGEVRQIFPYISVWIWSRALSVNLDGTYNHKILNITPYISSLNTTVGDNGGSFSIDVAPITAELGSGNWRTETGTQKTPFSSNGDYVNEGFLHFQQTDWTGDSSLKRSRHFFEKAFQQNDIVFIRFEKLVLENTRQDLDSLEEIPIDQLPGQIFDMIGLIDTPSIATNPESANVAISLSGRDLVKLIIEDGVYFYPMSFISGGIFANQGAANQVLDRFGANDEILTRFQVLNKNIDRSLKFIINSLATVDICPTDLFQGYAHSKDRVTGTVVDKRSRVYQLENTPQNVIQDKQRKIDDTKTQVLNSITQVRRVNNINSGTAVDVYNVIYGFLANLISADQIQVVDNSIQSWTVVIDEQAVSDQMPSTLLDLLFIRNRIWIDNKVRPINTLQAKNITSEIENLYSQINAGLFLSDSPLYQLSRINQDNFTNNATVNNTYYPVRDILSQLNTLLINSQLIDDEINDSPAAKIIKNTSNQSVSVQQDVIAIRNDYNEVTAQGQSISLLILEKTLSDLNEDEKNIFDQIYQIIQQENSIANLQPQSFQLEPVNGIWQIVKLVIDDSVKNRILADASIGNEMGSLINAIRKICQDPFCEFYTDTYGDQFYWVVRKKPFDRESILSMIQGRSVYEAYNPQTGQETIIGDLNNLTAPSNNSNSIGSKSNFVFGGNTSPSLNKEIAAAAAQGLVISINEIDVISDTLDYSQEAYSWYRLQLKNLISGSDSDMAFAYLRAVYFKEFADIFGSKPLDLSTNYIPYQSVIDKNQSLPTAYFIRQGCYDLKYMVESNAYLPFTREGTIVINGDRRIKRGTFIRLLSTDEIFYVDSVSHSFNINERTVDRTTTLRVSRGMVEKYIQGVQFSTGNNAINISYFNICDLTIDESVFTNQQGGFSDFNNLILSKWKVNPTVFNFFVKKLQFAKDDNELASFVNADNASYNTTNTATA